MGGMEQIGKTLGSIWVSVGAPLVVALIAILVGLYLEYRTRFFAQWLGRQGKSDVEKLIDQDVAKDLIEARKVAGELAGVLLTWRVWQRQNEAFEKHRPILFRLWQSPQLSTEVRAAIWDFLSAASASLTDDEPRERVPLAERRQSHEQLQRALDALLAITDKELTVLKHKG